MKTLSLSLSLSLFIYLSVCRTSFPEALFVLPRPFLILSLSLSLSHYSLVYYETIRSLFEFSCMKRIRVVIYARVSFVASRIPVETIN